MFWKYSCHVFSSSRVFSQRMFPLTKSPWTNLLCWFHLFPFCYVPQLPMCELRDLERWVEIYLNFLGGKKEKKRSNYGHCNKILLPPTHWGKTTTLKPGWLFFSQWNSLNVYVIMGRDYIPSFLCHIWSLNQSNIFLLSVTLLQRIYRQVLCSS